MSTADRSSILLRSPAATEKLGRALGKILQPHDFIALRGMLGAGKTLFVRGAAEGAEVPKSEQASSPTFALAHQYRGGRVALLHLDLYRLESERELFAIGFDDLLAEEVAVLCEWPEKAGSALPEARLELTLEHDGATQRRVSFEARGERAAELRGALLRHLKVE